jgi:hypothetical protein
VIEFKAVRTTYPGRTARDRLVEATLQSYLDSVHLAPSLRMALSDSALARGFAQGLRFAGSISERRYVRFSNALQTALENHTRRGS